MLKDKLPFLQPVSGFPVNPGRHLQIPWWNSGMQIAFWPQLTLLHAKIHEPWKQVLSMSHSKSLEHWGLASTENRNGSCKRTNWYNSINYYRFHKSRHILQVFLLGKYMLHFWQMFVYQWQHIAGMKNKGCWQHRDSSKFLSCRWVEEDSLCQLYILVLLIPQLKLHASWESEF